MRAPPGVGVAPEVKSAEVNLSGMNIHYLEAGEGPLVLMVHGYPTNAQLWRNILPAVGRNRRAVALDLPGFGRSDAPQGPSYDLNFFEKVITDFIDALGADKIGLCVHDAGGLYGLTWAVRHPERIKEVCLLNTLTSSRAAWFTKATIAAYKTPGIRYLLVQGWSLRWGMQAGMSRRSLSSSELSLYTEPFRCLSHRKAYLKSVAALEWRELDEMDRGLSQFSGLPVRVIYGSKDRILPEVEDTVRRVQQQLPQAHVTRLDGVGHFLQEDAPEEVARLMADFFGPSKER